MLTRARAKCHALGLAARDLGRLAALEARQLDQLEHLDDSPLDLRVGDLLSAQSERDVLVDREVRKERVILEYGVDVPLVGRQPRDVLAVELDQARGRLLEATDHPERRRLAASGRAEEAEELSVLHLEVDVIDRHDEPALVRIDDLGHASTRGVITERLVHLRQPDFDLCHVRLVPSEARPQLSARTYPDSAGALDVGRG